MVKFMKSSSWGLIILLKYKAFIQLERPMWTIFRQKNTKKVPLIDAELATDADDYFRWGTI